MAAPNSCNTKTKPTDVATADHQSRKNDNHSLTPASKTDSESTTPDMNYESLIDRLHKGLKKAAIVYSSEEDTQRLIEIQKTIWKAIRIAIKGREGDRTVPLPATIKQQVRLDILAIHERYDPPDEDEDGDGKGEGNPGEHSVDVVHDETNAPHGENDAPEDENVAVESEDYDNNQQSDQHLEAHNHVSRDAINTTQTRKTKISTSNEPYSSPDEDEVSIFDEAIERASLGESVAKAREIICEVEARLKKLDNHYKKCAIDSKAGSKAHTEKIEKDGQEVDSVTKTQVPQKRSRSSTNDSVSSKRLKTFISRQPDTSPLEMHSDNSSPSAPSKHANGTVHTDDLEPIPKLDSSMGHDQVFYKAIEWVSDNMNRQLPVALQPMSQEVITAMMDRVSTELGNFIIENGEAVSSANSMVTDATAGEEEDYMMTGFKSSVAGYSISPSDKGLSPDVQLDKAQDEGSFNANSTGEAIADMDVGSDSAGLGMEITHGSDSIAETVHVRHMSQEPFRGEGY